MNGRNISVMRMEDETSSRSTTSSSDRPKKAYSKTARTTLTADSSDHHDDCDVEEVLDTSSSFQNSNANESAGLLSHVDHVDIAALTRRTKLFGFLVLLLGLSSTTAFLYFGLTNAADEADDRFQTRAKELTLVVETTWLEYERTAASAHEICSRGNGTTRTEFQEFYEYLLADGIEFQSIQCVPNVTHAERAAHEQEAKAYWEARLPGFQYPGFTGVIFDAEKGEVTGVKSPESEEPFYFPIKYCEPPEMNQNAIDLDVYFDKQTFKPLLDYCIENQQPVLSGRINTVQELDDYAYSVLVYHPGVPLSTQPGKVPNMLSSLVVRVPSLLERVARLQEEDLAVYLYDNRPNGNKEFLGAAMYHVTDDEDDPTVVTFIPEEDYEVFVTSKSSDRLYEETIPIASGSWDVLVVPVDDTYEPENTLVIFGAAMLFAASIGITVWMYTNMKRMVDIYKAKTEAEAERTIVANLFPENVRERLLRGTEAQNAIRKENAKLGHFGAQSGNSKYDDPLSSEGLFGSKPIADFHPEATILFADLVGFTAWSSAREPTQVFTLLEVLYSAFDRIAKRRRIFKVETVGDCYVASAGVPIPLKDHAVVMARFAEDCLKAMPVIVHKLETTLGPDTGDLGIRMGLHSGAVTSGVLRGDKGRFQIFGDTMNTASRMESTGLTNRIQVSPETAEYLRKASKDDWLEPRDVKVFIKGKGHLQTYWLVRKDETHSQASSGDCIVDLDGPDACASKAKRLVVWNVEEMTKLLKQVVARRKARELMQLQSTKRNSRTWIRQFSNSEEVIKFERPLDEVKDVVVFPEFDAQLLAFEKQLPADSIEINKKVTTQLTEYVSWIAKMYQSNPFHNFEHASHVAMSVTKLLSRIATTELSEQGQSSSKGSAPTGTSESQDKSFGITSDPLTQFAAFFSALIHDVDHPGVPNSNFAQEKPDLANVYRNKSIAEQNSIDLAWALLMRDEFKDLRLSICADDLELKHFRQLVVQMVLATDVMDKEIGLLRKQRWMEAFSDEGEQDCSKKKRHLDVRNRKATIVIEHLIQASDVSHTMQHWHIYRKWNEALFLEMYHAYKVGRLASDPSEGWYEGEMGFLDFYVLPLAKKLEACGVFGVSSDEFRIYAMENRKEWELKGRQIVQDCLAKYNATMGHSYRIPERSEPSKFPRRRSIG